MTRLAFSLALLTVMWAVQRIPADAVGVFAPAEISLGYGFLLLQAYLLGEICGRAGLPKLSGYILAGILFGPFALGFVDDRLAGRMKLIDDLALTFIALTAGAELQLSVLRERRRVIAWVVVAGTVVVAAGTAAAVWLLRGALPFTRGAELAQVLAVGALFGVVAVARSPTSAIAIISECRARGPFTDTVFGVTVAVDSLVILLFAVAVSFGEAAVYADRGVDPLFVAVVFAQLLGSVAAGVGIGKAVAFYIRRIERDLTIFLIVVSFLITYASRGLSHAAAVHLGVGFHLEPLLIATAAGFTVQNFTAGGERLVQGLHAVSLPIFVVFFSMAGVGLDLGSLAGTWGWALLFVGLRMVLVSAGSYLGCAAGGEGRRFAGLSGLTFYTQAGVSLGLTQVIAARFPGWGAQVATFLVACIAVNQVLGPLTFKLALDRMGETGRAAARP